MWAEPSLLGALQGSSADKETNARETANQTFARGVRYRALTLIYTELIYCELLRRVDFILIFPLCLKQISATF